MVLFSFVILCYNNKSFLKDLIKSIKQQSIKSFEVIFVDNASTDSSVEYIKKNMPKAKIIALKSNVWFCKGNNIGYSHANGKYVIVSNSDVIFPKDYLSNINKKFIEYQSAGIISSIQIPFNTTLKKTKIYMGGWLFPSPLVYAPAKMDTVKLNVMSGACFAIKNKIVDHLYLDESVVYDDESFLSMQILTKGYEIIGSKDIFVWHYNQGSSQGIDSAFKTFMIHRNTIKHFLISFNKRTILALLPFIIFREIYLDLIMINTPRNLISKQKANLNILYKINEIIKEKKSIQKKRKITDKIVIEIFTTGEINQLKGKKRIGGFTYILWIKKYFLFLLKIGFWN